MKKNQRRVLLCALFLSLFLSLLPFTPALADDDPGYTITSFDTQVEVDESRAYHVTETLQVHFHEERQGILRSIPLQGDAETYHITNVSVEGDSYRLEEDHSNLVIRIGKRGTYHTGAKTYVIKYTLEHFQDYVSDGDYIYVDLLGTNWDTKIYKFTGSITYPSTATFDRLFLSSGGFETIGNNKNVTSHEEDHRIVFKGDSSFSPYEGVTATVRLKEGAFPKAPEFLFPYKINTFKGDYLLTKNKELQVKENLQFSITQEQINDFSSFVEFPLFQQKEALLKNFNLISSTNEIALSSPTPNSNQNTLSLYFTKPGVYDISYEYTLLLPLSNQNPFKKEFISPLTVNFLSNIEGPVLQSHFSFTSEVPLEEVSAVMGRLGDSDLFDISHQNEVTFFTSKNSLYPGDPFSINVLVNQKDFTRTPSTLSYLPLLAVLIGLLLTYYFFHKKGRDIPLASVVSIHPPDNLSSPEAGYVLNGKITNDQMITILYNWANDGYIQIVEVAQEKEKSKKKKSSDLNMVKLKDLSPSHPPYEIALFNKMFARGKEGVVTSKNLRNYFLSDLLTAMNGLTKKFNRGEKALLKKNSGYVFFSFLLGFIPLGLLSLVSAFLHHTINPYVFFAFVAYIFIFITWMGEKKISSIVLTLLFAIGLATMAWYLL